MNQTRVFLIVAWLMVAMLLWMEWSRERNAPSVPPATETTTVTPQGSPVAIPDAVPGLGPQAATTVPEATPEAASPPGIAPSVVGNDDESVVVQTDVLRLVLNGGEVRSAQLLQFFTAKDAVDSPVELFNLDPVRYYVAQSGWVSAQHAAPDHQQGFVPENAQRKVSLTNAAAEISVPFIWQGPDGVSIRRTFTLERGQYAVKVRDEVINAGQDTWQGQIYRQLIRKPLEIKRGYTNPDSFSFNGAAWFNNEGYQRRAFDKYLKDGKVNQRSAGSWIALLQHHFFSAWIPSEQDEVTISLDQVSGLNLIRAVGPALQVSPGQRAAVEARLYIGPKLVKEIQAQNVAGLDRAVDYSRFSIMALLGQFLFWILSKLHGVFGNWGWSIIGLVVLVKLVLYPLSATQYKSFAKMRKFQPRIQQLKERYGDDKQKFQVAMMELYKKEKINPMSGCLPILVQMPVFFALYWVLVESVELRQAPWFGWIQDLTARDPYFILPIINVAVMWFTQKLQPAPGMDPMQQRMMQMMPLVFGVMMALFPSGLVLYWVTNGALGLLQQWWMMKRHGENAPAKPAAPSVE
ncbi:MAG: membrane protein insertase YidC [Xanthomonadaceae bacterium]|jgi:YidC/Oxa1 family membrane protein insertase|nr:membrane protein insertase YidC [Xanthomonadaceae bacterium]